MKESEKLKDSFANLEKALARLEEAIEESDEDNKLAVDGTIQRFEFSIEIYWKVLKRLLASKGIESFSPRDTLKKAYANKWINEEQAWLAMLKDRNETSHIYDEERAKEIYRDIEKYFPVMKDTFLFLKENYDNL